VLAKSTFSAPQKSTPEEGNSLSASGLGYAPAVRPQSSERLPLDGLRVALAGPGRVGTSLAHWVRARGASIELVAGRDRETRQAVASTLGARAVPIDRLASAGCDLLLVAVADPALDEVAALLARRPQAAVALHTAGSRGASALEPLARRPATEPGGSGGEPASGSAPGSFHPLKAFPEPLPDVAEAAGTFFALDGPDAALAMGRRLAEAFGATAEVVPEPVRPLYHLAASVAAGGVVTLVATAAGLARELDLPDAVARGYLELASGAMSRARAALTEALERNQEPGTAARALAGAITGPVARGELETFRRQMALLGSTREAEGDRTLLFARLALETARLAAPGTGRTGSDARAELEQLLRKNDLL